MAEGRLVREGRVADLVSVSDQTEVVIRNATPDLLDEIREAVGRRAGAGVGLVSVGHPNTTLERVFLEATSGAGDGGASGGR
jgi:hypothetical protein